MPQSNMVDKFSSPEYKRSRKAYMAQCAFEYFITIFIADAFLAKLLTNIGISDALIGVISSITTLAFLFQILSVFVSSKIVNIKKTVVVFHILCHLLFMGLYIIPFLPFTTEVKTAIVILAVLFGYAANYLVASIVYKWANSYVHPHKRGEYSAIKEMISLFSGVLVTLFAGFVMDKYESLGNIEGGFIFISVSIFILALANFICLLLIKNQNGEENTDTTEKTVSFKESLVNVFKNKGFVNVIIMTCLANAGGYITIGFIGVYKTKELLFSVGAIQIINNIANLARLAVSLPFGKFSDRTSYASGLKLAYAIEALAFAVCIFTTPATRWFIVVYQILFNISLAGSNQNSFNISYSYIDSRYFVPALAIKNSIGGIVGFGASILGSKILQWVQGNNNSILGVQIYGQQVLSIISVVILVITILFIHFVIEKQKIIKQ